jgi:ubiquinone/menaquinone biosynthesis C-methylase UbiE
VTTIWAALGSSPGLVPICIAAWALAHVTLAAVAGSDDHSLGTPGAVALTMVLSLLGWAMPGVALNLVAHGFGSPHALGGLFYRSTVLGGLTGSPLGVGVTGVLFIHGLEHLGMAARGATLAVATFRAGTSWFALTAGLLALGAWRRSVFSAPPPVPAEAHFDAIASSYADQIPEFTRHRLIERKVRNIRDAVPPSTRGLEIGCGQGWYASALANEGFRIVACDASRAQVMAAARQERLGLTVCDSARLPYADATFAFAYAINVVHHITDASRRQETLQEVVRVLQPGGVFVLEEMNTTNPLFRFYMGYVFPLLHRIDEGTELWIQPRDLPPVRGASWSPTIDYMTFLPEFASPIVVRLLGPLERRLEQSRARAWSAHYAARLVKDQR